MTKIDFPKLEYANNNTHRDFLNIKNFGILFWQRILTRLFVGIFLFYFHINILSSLMNL